MPPGEDLADTVGVRARRWCCTWPPPRSTRSFRSCWPAATAPKPHVRWWRSPAGRSRRCCGARLPSSPSEMHAAGITRTAVIVVGDVLAAEGFADSYLYSSGRVRRGTALMRVLLLGGTVGGPSARRATASRRRRDQLTGRPGARSRAAGRRGPHRRVRRCRRDAAMADRLGRRRRRRRHPSLSPPRSPPHAAAGVRRAADLPHLVLARPAWRPGDAIVVDSDVEAAKTVAARRVFAGVPDHRPVRCRRRSRDVDAWFLIRAVTAPDPQTLPRRHELVLSRGPYRYDDELRPAARAPHRRVW